MKRYDPRTTRTFAEVDLSVLAANARAIVTAFAPAGTGDAILAVVKADAYGHGAVPIARVCTAAARIAHYGVATVDEALTLRKSGVRGDIYLLPSFLPEEAEAIVRGDIIPLISSPEQFIAVTEAAKSAPLPARAFLTVDTGMGREGMLPEIAREIWFAARFENALNLTGISSHLASADECDEEGTGATQVQADAFSRFVRSLGNTLSDVDDGRGNVGVWLSLCNSPGTLRRDEWPTLPRDLPGVRGILWRAGLLLYGIDPHTDAFAATPEIRPALSWRARVTLVRDLPAGATVGYGRTHRLTRSSRIATVAVGYADGFPRRLSNQGYLLLRGERLPIVGRVSMDQLQLDVTDATTPVTVGDTVTFIGTDGDATQSAFALAESIGATPHELTCYLSARVPRLYTKTDVS